MGVRIWTRVQRLPGSFVISHWNHDGCATMPYFVSYLLIFPKARHLGTATTSCSVVFSHFFTLVVSAFFPAYSFCAMVFSP